MLRRARVHSWLVAWVFAVMSGVSSAAMASSAPLAMLVLDIDSGRVLEVRAPLRPVYPASLVKLMTAYLVFEAIESSRLTLKQRISVSPEAAGQPPVRLGLRSGERVPLETLLDAMLLRSANDAAVVLAEAVAGTEARFVASMNATATRLGLRFTRFANATGLPGADQQTNAHDMALLTQRLLEDFPERTWRFQKAGMSYRDRYYNNQNPLLGSYQGAKGLKTGFTCDAGYSMVGLAERDGRRLIAIALSAVTRGERNRAVRLALNRAYGAKSDDAGTSDVRLKDLIATHERGAYLAARFAKISGPVSRLSRSECASPKAGPRRAMRWSLLVGTFVERNRGRRAAERIRKALGRGAQGTFVRAYERKIGTRASWKWLISGFGERQIGKACVALRGAGLPCIPQSPALTALPGYARR